jgi:hypothetical protein
MLAPLIFDMLMSSLVLLLLGGVADALRASVLHGQCSLGSLQTDVGRRVVMPTPIHPNSAG